MMITPLVTAIEVAFWATAPLMVAAALGLVLARKAVHSAICMAAVMIGLAIQYAAQDAPFLFVTQIIVYTGAILMLFLFVVMLVGIDTKDSIVETLKGHRIASFLLVTGVAALLLLAIGNFALSGQPVGLAAANEPGNPQAVAELLFGRWIILLEATSALLITAAVGAMVMAHGERLKPRKTQTDLARERLERYATEGDHPGPLPNSGVFARHNAIHIPALLPDGTVAESSVSETLSARGAIVDVDDLRDPSNKTFGIIERHQSQAEGDE